MKEDLRYLERLIPRNSAPIEHPSDELLAQYIDGKLEETQKNSMLEHLLICDTCSDIVANTVPQKAMMKPLGKSKLQIVNLFMAMAASVLLFVFISFPDKSELGMLNLGEHSDYKSPLDGPINPKTIDADKYLDEIISNTDMRQVKYFEEAMKLEKNEMYLEARELYKQAYISIRHCKDSKERIKQKILINHKLMLLGIKERVETDESIQEYKEILKYDIGIYAIKYKEKK